MQPIRIRLARSAASIALVAFSAGLAPSASAQQGPFAEPDQQLEVTLARDCRSGDARGEFWMPGGSLGHMSGELLLEGEAAYVLQADLTSYLPVFGPRDTHYGGIEGLLIPNGPRSCVPNQLRVWGGWSQAPGEAATFQAHVVEVNSVTGAVYGIVGALQGTLGRPRGLVVSGGGNVALRDARARACEVPRPGPPMRVSAAVRVDGRMQPARPRDAEPPELCAADLRRVVRSGAGHAPRRRVERRPVDKIPPPPGDGGLYDPLRRGWGTSGQLGGKYGAVLRHAAGRGGANHQPRRAVERKRREGTCDLPPEGLDREVPGRQRFDPLGGVRPATAAGSTRAHGGPHLDFAPARSLDGGTGAFVAVWMICV